MASSETVAGKRRKKTFSITEEGRAAFSAWVAQAHAGRAGKEYGTVPGCSLPDWPGRRNGLPLSGTTSDRWRIPESRCARSGTDFEQLKRQQLPPGSDWPQILRFQGYTIEYGIAAAAFEIGWYKQLLSELEEQP